MRNYNWVEINQHFISRNEGYLELANALTITAVLVQAIDEEHGQLVHQIANTLREEVSNDLQLLALVRLTVFGMRKIVPVDLPSEIILIEDGGRQV